MDFFKSGQFQRLFGTPCNSIQNQKSAKNGIIIVDLVYVPSLVKLSKKVQSLVRVFSTLYIKKYGVH